MKKRWLLLCILALLLSGCASSGTIRIGAAGESGVYYAFSEALSDLVNKSSSGNSMEVRTTAGSAANLRLLSDGYVQMAIAQADLAQDAYDGEGIFADGNLYRGYGAVAGLYTEACHIVVRADSDIVSIEDLQGRTVSVGEEESGTEQNAEQILEAYGLSERLVDEEHLDYTAASERLADGTIDAVFLTIGTQSEVVAQMAQQCGIRLLSVDGKAAERLRSAYSSYQEYVIPAGTYPGQEEDVSTVGVKAVLLASERVSAETVEAVTQALFSGAQELSQVLPEGSVLEPESAAEGIQVPFHQGAAAYYADCGITVETE
ncbi:MAG: TAXI family TRAP transporter solute-binding subunit [Eubacteriales bacterium]|nr:TAXI family TRAP transporter solute-binding subunit [Eubacteriales bacterium]